MFHDRRRVCQALPLWCAAPVWPAVAYFPARPVRLIVPYAVGVGPDVVARALAQRLDERWTQPTVVENRPGASGILAFQDLRRSAADGHLLFVGDGASLATNALLFRSLPYDVEKDVEPISLLFQATFVLWTGAASPWTQLSQLVAFAKAHPGALRYATLGHGHTSHLALESWCAAAGIRLEPIPFKDAGALFVAVANQDVALAAFSAHTAQGLYRAGRWKPLAVAARQRLASHPEIPTLEEAGSPATLMHPWAALVAPAGAPASTLDRVRAEVHAAMAETAFRERVIAAGFEPLPSGPEAVRARAEAERRSCQALMQAGRLSPIT